MRIMASALFFMLFSLGVHAAKYYKWEDEQGITHYTAIAPSNTASETINTRTGERKAPGGDSENRAPSNNIGPDDQTATTNPEPDLAQQPATPKVAPPSQQELARIQEEKNNNCKKTQKNLETLTNRPRVRINDRDTGELRYLTPEEQLSMKEDAEKYIDEFCR